MLTLIQSGKPLSFKQRLILTAQLSWPAIMAQLSSILMQYIDAAMVGRLGADDSAAVGLVSTSLWLFWGICSAATVGFSVQVAHRMGAADYKRAREIFRQGITASFIFGLCMAIIGAAISGSLPVWLGGSGAGKRQSVAIFYGVCACIAVVDFELSRVGDVACFGKYESSGRIERNDVSA